MNYLPFLLVALLPFIGRNGEKPDSLLHVSLSTLWRRAVLFEASAGLKMRYLVRSRWNTHASELLAYITGMKMQHPKLITQIGYPRSMAKSRQYAVCCLCMCVSCHQGLWAFKASCRICFFWSSARLPPPHLGLSPLSPIFITISNISYWRSVMSDEGHNPKCPMEAPLSGIHLGSSAGSRETTALVTLSSCLHSFTWDGMWCRWSVVEQHLNAVSPGHPPSAAYVGVVSPSFTQKREVIHWELPGAELLLDVFSESAFIAFQSVSVACRQLTSSTKCKISASGEKPKLLVWGLCDGSACWVQVLHVW